MVCKVKKKVEREKRHKERERERVREIDRLGTRNLRF